jgi:antibiotic biosynthesis monooxygenase (ABM) superfamily enzyme
MPDVAPAGVSVLVSIEVQPGKEEDYERVLNAMLAEAARFPGYRQAHVDRAGGRFGVQVEFGTAEQYQAWEVSPQRHRWAAQLPGLLAEAVEQRQLGNKALARSVLSPIGCEPLRRCPSYLIHLARSGRGCITHTVCLL